MAYEFTPAVRARLRAERKRRRWDVARLAREMLAAMDDTQKPSLASLIRYIERWETGNGAGKSGKVYGISERYRLVYAAVFDTTEEELFGDGPVPDGEQTPEPQAGAQAIGDTGGVDDSALTDVTALAWMMGKLDHSMDRRAVLQLAATLTAAPALGVADPVERMIHALKRPTGTTDEVVHHLEARTIGFHRLEFMLPARQLYRAVLAHLNEIATLLEVCTDERLRQRLARTAGETAVLGAWLAWDLGDIARTISLHRMTRMAAVESDDPAITACSVIYQSFAEADHAKARRELAAVRQALPVGRDQATRAWLMGREAERAAALGDPSARDLIERASEMLTSARPQTERSWTRCLESPGLPHMRINIATHLKDEATVHDTMSELALSAGDPEQKKTGRMLATIGLALVSIGDVSEGIKFGERAINALRVSQAAYAMDRVNELDAALGRLPGPAPQQLRRDIRLIRRELASPRPSTPDSSPVLH